MNCHRCNKVLRWSKVGGRIEKGGRLGPVSHDGDASALFHISCLVAQLEEHAAIRRVRVSA